LLGQKNREKFGIDKERALRFNNRICMLNDLEIKKMILEETHKRKLGIHVTQMYKDLKKNILVSKMEKKVL